MASASANAHGEASDTLGTALSIARFAQTRGLPPGVAAHIRGLLLAAARLSATLDYAGADAGHAPDEAVAIANLVTIRGVEAELSARSAAIMEALRLFQERRGLAEAQSVVRKPAHDDASQTLG